MAALDEAPSRIEPCLLDEVGPAILDLAAGLSAAATNLGAKLHPSSAAALAEIVRVMNCYYSNLIEGHRTTPREIEAALQGSFESDAERRDLQLEARAHIRLQRDIDRKHAAGQLGDPVSVDFIRWLHREFYADATDTMLTLHGSTTPLRIRPGEFRVRPEEEVTVGRHRPPAPSAVATFMDYFARRYASASLGAGSRILAIAAAHHRFNYIHPFLDGNGRVSRLISHAMGLNAGIGAHGLWSVSRGLARGLERSGEYKRQMDHADMPRQGDLDGRGNLSRRALAEFTTWFLQVCLDQVTFMTTLFDLDSLADRLRQYSGRRQWRPEAWLLLERALLHGAFSRGDAARITGLKERTARTLLAELVHDQVLGSEMPKGPVSLRFPAHAVEIIFPALFPII